MFIYLDIIEFGSQLRKVREKLNISRSKVEDTTGITQETIRKIEKGIVIPKLDTLQILSSIYKCDLLELLAETKDSNKYYALHEEIDKLFLFSSDEESHLTDFKEKFLQKKSINTVEDPIEVEQFNIFIDALLRSYTSDSKIKLDLLTKLVDALKLRHSDFNIENFDSLIYTYFEIRILFLCSVIYAELGDYLIANRISYYILESFEFKAKKSLATYKLKIKVLCNISCNYHVLNDNEKALEIAEMGIQYCIDNSLLFLLDFFCFRKAIALFLLNREGYETYFQYISCLLSLQGRFESLKSFKESAERIYGIKF
jgi:transcriptional regulator with XRE-family HTH domain